jgi:DNA invertase Pin-like site-specific DNA recombinase
MSRFGRTSGELVNQLEIFIKIGVHFIFLKENLNTKDSNSKLITKLMISIFSGIYQFERDLLSERTKEGLIRAKAEGKIIGRPKGSKGKRLKLDLYYDKIKHYKNIGLNHTSIARLLSVHPVTLTSFIKRRGLLKKTK